MARPFLGLCLLEESLDLSRVALAFLPVAAGGWGVPAASLMASGATAGFSIGASGVELGGPTGLIPPVASAGWAGAAAGAGCAGVAAVAPGKPGGAAVGLAGAAESLADGCTISIPMELPREEVVGADCGTLVSTEPVLPAEAVGTSWNESGAAATAAGALESAVAAGELAGAFDAAARGELRLGFIEVLKSDMDLRTIAGATVAFGSSSEGVPMVAAGTVSA